MDLDPEVSRLESHQNLATLPTAGWLYEIRLDAPADAVLDKITAVVRNIVSSPLESWPGDDEWRRKLPPWLLQALPVLTREQCQHLMGKTPQNLWHTLPWDFGSWLDAIKRRGWRWWGYSVQGGRLTLVLEILSEPAGLEAFEVIVSAAGATISGDRRINPAVDSP
jgi:hypothetical protein